MRSGFLHADLQPGAAPQSPSAAVLLCYYLDYTPLGSTSIRRRRKKKNNDFGLHCFGTNTYSQCKIFVPIFECKLHIMCSFFIFTASQSTEAPLLWEKPAWKQMDCWRFIVSSFYAIKHSHLRMLYSKSLTIDCGYSIKRPMPRFCLMFHLSLFSALINTSKGLYF